MSGFVNYSHRGVTLPPGCKDLADLLNPKDPVQRFRIWTNSAIAKSPHKLRKIRYETGTLSDVLRCAEGCFAEGPEAGALVVGVKEGRYTFALQAAGAAGIFVNLRVGDSPEAPQKVRIYAEQNGLRPAPFNNDNTPTHDDAHPYLTYVLPAEPSTVPQVTDGLAREVYGLADEPAIRFARW